MKHTPHQPGATCCGHAHCGSTPEHQPQAEPHEHEHGHEHADAHVPASSAQLSAAAASGRARLQIMAMDCPTEARLIEKALAGMPGVVRLHFDFFERVLTVEHALPSLDGVIAAIGEVGMQAELMDAQSLHQAPARNTGLRAPLWFALSGVAAVLAEAVSWLGHALPGVLVPALALLSIVLGGLPTLRKGWIALRSRSMNIHFLMTLAVTGALLIGQWPEAAMVLFLFGVAERLEAMSLARAGAAVRSLMALVPARAWVADAQGEWQELAVESVAIGARLRVRPGERVPLDGEIVSGQSNFNEAAITGESLPVDKGVGQGVFAGSINGAAVVEVRVTAAADGSLLARIIDSVRDAQGARAPTQRFIDKFARYYTPLVVACAVLSALLLPWLTALPLKDAVYQSLVLLVIACPCAMVIATPVTLVSALSAAARHGILIKGGEALETAARVRVVAFDKTGTLTTGRAAVIELVTFAEPDADRLLALAAALDADSTHPLARALQLASQERGLSLPRAEGVSEQSGFGVQGTIAGEKLALGSRRLAIQHTSLPAEVGACLDRLESQGHATLVLLKGEDVQGVIALADGLREQASEAITLLSQQGVHSVILSGDNQRVVSTIAAASGVEEAHGALLPQDKLQHIERLQQRYGAVAMVGDGINDAPALARADLGVAMGAASDTALETAAVALMDNRLEQLPRMLAHARRSMRVLKFNLGLALAIKLVFFALAYAGVATLWMAVFADVGTSLLVVANGLRLARALD